MNQKLKKEINKTTDLISSLIHEYLYKNEYTRTLDIFQQELAEKIKSGTFYSIPQSQPPNSENLLSFFKSGNKDQFIQQWKRLIPNKSL